MMSRPSAIAWVALFLYPLIAKGTGVAHADEILIPSGAVREKSSKPPRLFVVAIGVGTFGDPFWPSLKWAERDAARVAATFGQGTDRQPVVTVLKGPSATLQGIQKTLSGIASKARRQDAIALYISTHGTLAIGPNGDLEPILVLSQTNANDLSKTGLPESSLRVSLDKIPTSRKLLIIAACHSGLGKSRLTPRVREILSSTKGRTSTLGEVSEGFFVMSAAARGETAREDDQLQSDVYTHYFLEALKRFDRNHDGAVSALEAHDYARDHAFDKTGGKQRATLEAQSIGNADLMLQGRVTHEAWPVFEARGEELSGLMVSVDGREKGRLPTAIALNPNKSKIELFRVGQKKPFAAYVVSAPKGAYVQLEDLLTAQPWSLGIEYGVGFVETKTAKRVLESPLRRLGLIAGRRILPHFALGVGYTRTQSLSRQIRTNVAATAFWSTWEARGEYVHTGFAMQDWALGAGLGVGRSKADLTLAGTNDRMSYTAASTTWTPYIFGEWRPRFGMSLRLSGRYSWDEFDFGEPGALNAARMEFALSLLYHFGGTVRRQ